MIAIGVTAIPIALFLVLLIAMALTALYGWTVERFAYRPLRGSFRLAPLISAIGMSILLQNYVQIAQGARVLPLPPLITGGHKLIESETFPVQISNVQIIVIVTTFALMVAFSFLVAKTRLGRDMRACEQDLKMASILGVNIDRTISLTFVTGAALAAVAGIMYLLYYGVVDFFIGFVAGVKAFTAAVLGGIGSLPGAMLGGLADRPDRDHVVGLLLDRIQGRRGVLDPDRGADLPADRHPGPAGSGEGVRAVVSTGAPLGDFTSPLERIVTRRASPRKPGPRATIYDCLCGPGFPLARE